MKDKFLQKGFPLFLIFLFFFFLPSTINAANIFVENVPAQINHDQEFEISVRVSSAAANTNNYLRAAFYSEASKTSYFGFTFNNSATWYNGTPSPIDSHQFFQINIDSDGNWSNKLKVKADINSDYFKGNGSYYFKIGRYTANGSSVTDWSDPTLVNVYAPSPTPTLTPTVVPTNTVVPTKVPTASSTTKSSTPTLAKSQTTPALITSTEEKEQEEDLNNPSLISVLGDNDVSISADKNASPTGIIKTLASSNNNLPKVFIGIGIIFLIACGILSFRTYQKSKMEDQE
ncbi:hypothetical protein C4559_05755 [Candidatus Microgenomates bacterium]|nr:MAG: hypothetical protein C4559_05755 [Candidatus Microgenomates bacterium]